MRPELGHRCDVAGACPTHGGDDDGARQSSDEDSDLRTAATHRRAASQAAAPAGPRRPAAAAAGKAEAAMQAGARPYPVPPFPRQHQRKPGLETCLDPPPMYEAPYWKGSFKLWTRSP